MDDLVMAVDLGGTKMRIALYGPDLTMLDRHEEPTRAHEGVGPVLDRLIERMQALGAAAGWNRIRGVGVSAPGPQDTRRGLILWVPGLPDWREVPLTRRLSRAVGKTVFLGNDANVAALAEHRRGTGQGHEDMVYITVSTGIGGGVVSGGRLVVGQRGLAGEIGHMTLEPNGPRCNCGNTGCLESLASGTAIARQAQDLVAAGAHTCIAELVDGDMQRITAKVVHEAAEKGDVVAVDLFRKAGKYLGLGLVNLMYLFNPGLVVVGGGVTKAGDLLFVPMRATIQDRINQVFWRNCTIVAPALGEDVCLMGAAILASDGLSANE